MRLSRTSSKFNALCLPVIYKDLNILKDPAIAFEELYELILRPYAQYVKTIRFSFGTNSMSDDNVATILTMTTNVTSILLYHLDFDPRFQQLEEQEGLNKGSQKLDWMHFTNLAIIKLLEEYSLNSVGIYSERIITRNRTRVDLRSTGPISLLNMITASPVACISLKRLDIALYTIPVETYDFLRRDLTSLTSLTINHTLKTNLGRIWDPEQCAKWFPNSNLTRLQMRGCRAAYAPHITHLVRHFISLRHLLISMCGHDTDIAIPAPPQGWYSAEDALWKVRKPLETFHLELAAYWEIGAMGDIPTKLFIYANTAGESLVHALKDDSNYLPMLETIRIERRIPRFSAQLYQFSQEEYKFLLETCRKRGVSLLEDAEPTSWKPQGYGW